MREANQLLDESDTAVGEQEVGAAGMKRPVLVAVGKARGGIGAVPFAGVREDERAAAFGVEARFGLERHQGNGRVGDGAGPARARQVLAPLARGEGLACAVGDLGDVDRVIAEEEPVAVVAAGGAVIGVDDLGIEARGVAAADRADIVRRGNVADRGTGHCAGRCRIDHGERILPPGIGRAEEAADHGQPGGLVGRELDPQHEIDAVVDGELLHLVQREGGPSPAGAVVVECHGIHQRQVARGKGADGVVIVVQGDADLLQIVGALKCAGRPRGRPGRRAAAARSTRR